MTRAPFSYIAWIALLGAGCTAYPDEATEQEPVAEAASAVDSSLSGLAAWAVDSGASAWSLGSDAAGNALYVGPVDGGGWLLVKRDPYGKELFRTSLPHRPMHAGFGLDGTIALAGGNEAEIPADFGCGAKAGAFVVKLSATGSCLWHRPVWVQQTWDPMNVRIAGDGRVVVTGDTFDAIDLGEGLMAANQQSFVARYDQAGELEGARIFGAPRGDAPRARQSISDTELDAAGNIYLGGHHYDALSFEDVVFADPGTAPTASAAFFVKIDKTGIPRSGRSFGPAALGNVLDVTADGRVALAGQFNGTMDFGNGKTLFNGSGSADTFIAVFETDGSARWVKRLWGRAKTQLANIAFDRDGNVAIGGAVSTLVNDTTSTFHIGALDFDVPPNSAFVARFAPLTGSTRWAHVYSTQYVRINTLAVTPNNSRVLIGGFLSGTVDFGRSKVLTGELPFLTRLYP